MTQSCTIPILHGQKSKVSKIRPVFLDADGVLWQDRGAGSIFLTSAGVSFLRQIHLIKGLFSSSSLFVISNQTCVARGLCKEVVLRERIQYILNSLQNISPSMLFSYCPHHPSATDLSYQKNCLSRKPNPNQILSILEEFNLDVGQSIFVGDRITDLEAAEKLGMREKYLITNPRAFEINELSHNFKWSQTIEFKLISELSELERFV